MYPEWQLAITGQVNTRNKQLRAWQQVPSFCKVVQQHVVCQTLKLLRLGTSIHTVIMVKDVLPSNKTRTRKSWKQKSLEELKVRRDFKITQQLVKRYGETDGCPGCKCAMMRGGPRREHTVACRTKMEKSMVSDPEQAEK